MALVSAPHKNAEDDPARKFKRSKIIEEEDTIARNHLWYRPLMRKNKNQLYIICRWDHGDTR
jgi:hypothetical protein